MARNRVLVVDDEAGIRFGVRDFLEARGYQVEEADGCAAAEEACQSFSPDAALVDYLLPDGNALDLLPRLRALDATMPIVILTAHGSIELAVRAVKEGADHFLTKPIEMATLEVILRRALEQGRARHWELAARARQARGEVDPFLGSSSVMRRLEEQSRRVLSSDSAILIQGETGTGKGVLAQWIHRNGPRASEAFVDLNCAGLSRELLESELFGHGKGAFTGAESPKEGLFEVANRGTVFLDEIGDVDLTVQPKLLKVIEEKRFRRLGEVRDRYVDVRLVAATHQDLAHMVRAKRFRSDLYFRISTIPLLLPPLRDRGEDIPLLARAILERIASDMGRGEVTLQASAERALGDYPWPGNIRELRNVLERAILLGDSAMIRAEDLRLPTGAAVDAEESALTLEEVERRHVAKVMRLAQGQVSQAARMLGIGRSSLYERLRRYGLDPSSFGTPVQVPDDLS